MRVSTWKFFPGLIETLEKEIQHTDPEKAYKGGIITFPPAIDATTGQVIQIFGHPLRIFW